MEISEEKREERLYTIMNSKFLRMEKPHVFAERLGLRWAVYITHPSDPTKRLLCPTSGVSFNRRKMTRLASSTLAQINTAIWIGLKEGLAP